MRIPNEDTFLSTPRKDGPVRHLDSLAEWLAPALFGLLLYAVIRFHGTAWTTTLPQVTVLIAGVAIILLVLTRAHARLSIPRSLGIVLVGLAMSVALSTIASRDPLMAVTRLLLYLAIALLAVGVYSLYRDSCKVPIANYFLVIAVVQVPYTVEVILEMIEWNGRLFPNGPNVANFANVRFFGHLCFLAAVSGLSLALLSRRLAVAAFLPTCFALFGIIATGSRAPLLAWVVFLLLLLCIGPSRRKVAALGLSAMGVSALVVWGLQSSGLLLTPNFFARVGEYVRAGGKEFDSGRLDLWLGAIRQIIAHPLFGQGPEAYELSHCCDSWVAHPHNFVLQLLMEFGLVGCSLLLLLCVCAVRLMGGAKKFLSVVSSSVESRLLACALLAYFAIALVDGMFYFAVPLINFALFCGLFAAGLSRSASRKRLPIMANMREVEGAQ